MELLTIKALHIIFIVCWFCGLFYIVRLFIYFREAQEKEEPEKTILEREYIRIQRLLWRIITAPSMVLVIFSGILMLWVSPNYLQQDWMIIKLILVFGLLLYHFQCGRIFKAIRTRKLTWSSYRLRLWNEVATVFLVAIVFLAVKKSLGSWGEFLFFFVLFIFLLFFAVKLVKSFRKNK